MKLVSFLAGATLLAAAPLALAQDYPTRQVTVVVAQAAGGAADTATRLWTEYMQKHMGQPFIVDNKPGAGGILGTQAVLQQQADGYTLYSAGTSSMVLNLFAYKSLPYDPAKDFRGVAMLAKFSYLLLVNPSSGIRTVEDLARRAKADPGKLNYGISVIGDGGHLMVEMLNQQLGAKMTAIPYKAETASLAALLGGQTDMQISSIGIALPQAQSGKLTALAVLGDKRLPELPNVPTTAQAGLKGLENLFWAVIVAKAGTPDAAARKLNVATQEFLKQPEVLAQFQKLRFDPMPGPVDAYEKILASDIKKWGDVTKTLNLPQQ